MKVRNGVGLEDSGQTPAMLSEQVQNRCMRAWSVNLEMGE